jgi:hypothetical protein
MNFVRYLDSFDMKLYYFSETFEISTQKIISKKEKKILTR